jgi:alpha-mannosidase
MKHRIFGRLALFALAVVAFSPFGWAQSKVVGDWTGTLDAGGPQLRVDLHIFEGKDGSLTATTDSVDQGQYAIPVTTTTFKDSKLTFTIDNLHVTFEGVINKEGTEIDGKVTQGQAMELKLKRASAQSGAFSAVIGRLSGMHELPDGAWKIHTGDLAHGERVNLDESGWKPVATDGKLGADSVWFRQTYQIPETLKGYNLTGARVWFQLNVDAGNAHVTQIINMNGKRAAMGEDLEPMALFEDAKPGDKVTVAVKVLATPGEKTFQGVTLRIDFPDKALSPEDLRQEILSAKQLIPSLAPGDTASLAALDAAVSAIDLKALDAHDQAKFEASLKDAQAKLEVLKPLMKQNTVTLNGQSHIDAAWLWPWTETVDVVRRTFGTSLQLMREYPTYTFTQSAAAYNEWMAQKYPTLNAEIAKRIQEGRWEIVGGMWVEPDLNLPDGESLVRQLLVGKRWFKQAYGTDVRIGWNPDSFGFSWQLPQIYKKSGVDYFVTTKLSWNDTNNLPLSLFWWESPDGSKVLTYFGNFNSDLTPTGPSSKLAEVRTNAPGATDALYLYGVGDHGGGPTRATLEEGLHWTDSSRVVPKFEFGTAQSFFSKVEKQIAPESPTWDYASIAKGYTKPAAVAGKVVIPTWKSELYLEYHRGIFTTQANQKRNIRQSEVELLNAEKFSSIAWLYGSNYPSAELTEDWKKALFNQFHDLAPGSGIGVIYKDAQKDFDVVRWSTNEIKAGALDAVAEKIDTAQGEKGAEGQSIVVFNPLGWERSGEVAVKVHYDGASKEVAALRDSDGKVVVATITSLDPKTEMAELLVPVNNVPALGYKVLQVGTAKSNFGAGTGHGTANAGKAESTEKAGTLSVSNQNLRVVVDAKSGCITSLFDKKGNFEALAKGACGNQLQFFKDKPKDYDAWNIDPGTLDVAPTVIDQADAVERLDGKSGDSGIRVTRHWQGSKFVQTIRLAEGSDNVDIDNEIDWHETHILLKAAFPLAATSGFATYEIPYGTIDRPTTRNNSWEKAKFEVPALRWADLSGAGADGKVHGLSLLNQSKYGYDAAGNVLRLTLLRSPIDPDPEADRGHHHFHYALYPHAGTWKEALTIRHGWEYNYPLTAVVTAAHPGTLPASHSFASVTPENVILTAVKKAEDTNGLIFRVYEWAGKDSTVEFHVPVGATGATVTNMMETPEGAALPISGDVVKAPIHPYEILTIRVDYPSGGPKQ